VVVVISRQFEQLPMFLTAQQVKDRYSPGDFFGRGKRGSSAETEFWDEKYSQAAGSDSGFWGGLKASIEREGGVRTPIEVSKEQLLNGHHRVAVLAKDHPDWLMPVNHRSL